MSSEKPNVELDVPYACSRIEIKVEGADSSSAESTIRCALRPLLEGSVNNVIHRDPEDGIYKIERDPQTPLTDDQRILLEDMAFLKNIEILFF